MASKADDDRYDGMYLNLAQANQGIDNLLESFFGFLRRKTDFFTGASEEQLEKSLLGVSKLNFHLAAVSMFVVLRPSFDGNASCPLVCKGGVSGFTRAARAHSFTIRYFKLESLTWY